MINIASPVFPLEKYPYSLPSEVQIILILCHQKQTMVKFIIELTLTLINRHFIDEEGREDGVPHNSVMADYFLHSLSYIIFCYSPLTHSTIRFCIVCSSA